MSLAPFYDAKLVPKGPVDNLRWRVKIGSAAIESPALCDDLMDACSQDILFWLNGFCWLLEPRPRPKVLPFVTWPHQDPCILAIEEALGYRDFAIEKSRGEGATWMYLMVGLHHWLYEPLFSAGLVSRTEEAVDSRDDPDSLMWKLDWQLEMLPRWMVPKFKRSFGTHTLKNLDNEATYVGYSATGDVASGGRKTVFFMDELAKFGEGDDYEAVSSTQHVTECRGLISTYKGDHGAYRDAVKVASGIDVIVLKWQDNPTRNRGLYRWENGGCAAVDPRNNPLSASYEADHAEMLGRLLRRGFMREGQERSPWYDRQCDRPATTPQMIAEELDRNPTGTSHKVFDYDMLRRMEQEEVRPPLAVGRLEYHDRTFEPTRFARIDNEAAQLWCPLGLDRRPPRGRYVIGGDIALGGGGDYTSNSALVVANLATGEQAAQFASHQIKADRFAELAVAWAKFFNNAHLAWEANGPGGAWFTRRIVEDGLYADIYYRTSGDYGSTRKSRKPGWWPRNDEDKAAALYDLGSAMDMGDFVPRSGGLVGECGQFEVRNGKIVHVGEQRSKAGTGKGKAHGDVAIAAAVCWLAMKELLGPKTPTKETKLSEREEEVDLEAAPHGSMAWLLNRRARELETLDDVLNW